MPAGERNARVAGLKALPQASRSVPAEFCLLVTLVAVLLVLALGRPAVVLAFADVKSGSQEHEAVQYLVNAGVLAGYQDGTFRPGQAVTRAQAVKMLVLQQGLTPSAFSPRFKDVDATYAAYVEAASAAGWVSGYRSGVFGPYDNLQRQHLAVWLIRSFGWDAVARALPSAEVQTLLAGFSDVGQLSAESKRYVALCVKRGFMLGDGAGHLGPTAAVTRAQTALLLHRAELSTLAVASGLRFSSDHTDRTRVVLDLTAAPGVVTSEVHGGKLFVQVGQSFAPSPGLSAEVDSPEVGVVQVSQGSYRPQELSVALDLRSFSRYNVFVMTPSGGLGNRVVVDVYRKGGSADDPLVAIDPGHGGWDPGTCSVLTGLPEKTVNLAIAKHVDQMLRGVGLRTVMTRTQDVALGPTLSQDLVRRGEIANEAGATILIMIHNNAHDGDSNGTETFYWGTPATGYSVEGMRLAAVVQQRVVEAIGLTDRGCRDWYGRNLTVLDTATMPGVMVEVAFMDNPTEAALLEDPAFLKQAARGIARGALEYLGWDPDLVHLP